MSTDLGMPGTGAPGGTAIPAARAVVKHVEAPPPPADAPPVVVASAEPEKSTYMVETIRGVKRTQEEVR